MTGCSRIALYHPAFYWKANGVLPLFPVSVAGALDGLATANIGAAAGDGSFDGIIECFTGKLIDTNGFKLIQRVDGTFGSTVVELYRHRTATWTLLGQLTLAFGGGGGASASMTPATTALRKLDQGDLLACILVSAQANSEDLTVSVSFA